MVIANMTKIELLILDEHTAALDPKSSETMMYLTDKLIHRQGITTLMVTHNLRYAVEYGSRLVMMHEGKIVKDLCGQQKQICRYRICWIPLMQSVLKAEMESERLLNRAISF